MGLWYYSYDASSNLTGQTDARGCATSLTYDLRPEQQLLEGDEFCCSNNTTTEDIACRN